MKIIKELGYDLEDLRKLDKESYIKWHKEEIYGNDEEALYSYELLHGLL